MQRFFDTLYFHLKWPGRRKPIFWICTKMLTGTLRRGLRPRTPRRSQPVGSRGTRGRPPPWRGWWTMRKLPTLPSTTSTVCPDISAGNGGNVQEISCSKLKTLQWWRLIITFVNVINRGGNSVIKRQNLWWVCCGPSSNNQSHAALAITFIEE